MTRFQTARQRDFNESVVEALRETERLVSFLEQAHDDQFRQQREAVDRVQQEKAALRQEQQAGVDELRRGFEGRFEALHAVIDQHLSELQEVRAGLEAVPGRLAEVRGEVDQQREALHAQGLNLDEVAGHLASFEDSVSQVRGSLSVIAEQAPTLAEEVRARLQALERCLRPDVYMDHFDFARRFRGDEAIVKERMRGYAKLFGPVHHILDVGCGRGEFLEACAELGVGARGVDCDEDMVQRCQMKGLEVVHGDLLGYLESLEDRSLDGLFSAQTLAHLTTPELTDLVRSAAYKLRRGARFVAETINPDSFSALRLFYTDLTQRRPIPSATLRFLLEDAGFAVRDILYPSPVPDDEKLVPLPRLPETAEGVELVATYNRNCERLNELLYGSVDYAIIAER